MIDSYRAPRDLAAARQRVYAAAEARCLRLGIDPRPIGLDRLDPADRRAGLATDGDAVVFLDRRPFDGQRRRISADTACVIADLVLWRWDDASLLALSAQLGPDTALVFLEPTADLGWRRLVHRLTKGPARLLLGHHFVTDVPAALRACGLVVTTTDRFGLGPLGIGSYVWGQAEHIDPSR